MDRMINAHQTAGLAAAAARVMASSSVSPVQQTGVLELGRGYGWQMVSSPCNHSDFNTAITMNKRQPRRLGQRTT
jgi:hypothetical protein